MKRTIILLVLVLPITAFAEKCNYAESTQTFADSEWGPWMHGFISSGKCDHMADVISSCKSTGFVTRHAIKIRFNKTGEEKTYLCSDVLNKSH